MDKQTILFLLGGGIVTPLITLLITWLVNKNKTKAETQNINITGEVGVGDFGLRYATKIEADNDKLRVHLDKVIEEFESRLKRMEIALEEEKEENAKLKEEKIILIQEKKDLNIKIDNLEARIDILEKELKKYQVVEAKVETTRDDLHASVDSSIDNLKQ